MLESEDVGMTDVLGNLEKLLKIHPESYDTIADGCVEIECLRAEIERLRKELSDMSFGADSIKISGCH